MLQFGAKLLGRLELFQCVMPLLLIYVLIEYEGFFVLSSRCALVGTDSFTSTGRRGWMGASCEIGGRSNMS